MESIHLKYNFYIFLLIILNNEISHVLSGGNNAETETPSNVLPLILIKTSDSLQLPSVASPQSVFLYWEKVKFNASPGEEQFYFCEAETDEQTEKIEEIREKAEEEGRTSEVVDLYCLLQKTYSLEAFKISPPTCLHEPEPIITKIYEKHDDSGEQNQLRCGPDKKSYYFRFGYRIWLNKGFLEKVSHLDTSITNAEAYPYRGVIDFEIYRFCYDETSKKVLHTEHKTLSPRLLFSDKLREENEKTYDLSICAYDQDNFHFENLKKAYEAVNYFDDTVMRTADPDTLKDVVIPERKKFKIQKLVPSNDFPFALWRKPTFHYANTKLMHEDLLPMWDHITKIIAQYAKRDNLKFNIFTGTFNVSNKDHSKTQFNDYLEASEIWVKILHIQDIGTSSSSPSGNPQGSHNAVAILAVNYLNGSLTDYLTQYCTTNYCTNFAEDKYPLASKYIMCCEVTDTIKQLFEIELKTDELLEIEGFIQK